MYYNDLQLRPFDREIGQRVRGDTSNFFVNFGLSISIRSNQDLTQQA